MLPWFKEQKPWKILNHPNRMNSEVIVRPMNEEEIRKYGPPKNMKIEKKEEKYVCRICGKENCDRG